MGKRERLSGVKAMETNIHITEIENILRALEKADTRKKKMAILKANCKNTILASIILYTTGGVKSGITREKLERSIFYISEPSGVPKTWNEMQRYFMLCPTGTDEDIAVTQLYIKNYSKKYRENLSSLICREINLGVTKAMAVKIFGEEIYESTYTRER